MEQTKFRLELEQVINRNNVEIGSNTPDFILAEYLLQSIDAFDKAVKAREQWYGVENKII